MYDIYTELNLEWCCKMVPDGLSDCCYRRLEQEIYQMQLCE